MSSLQSKDFRKFLFSRTCMLASHYMILVGLSQYIYLKTRDPLYLGYIGLAFFLPKILFTLLAGHIADRHSRKQVIQISRSLQVIATALLFFALDSLPALYSLFFVLGTLYAFDSPSGQAIVAELVPPEHFSHAVTWNSYFFQVAMVTGPALGGFLYAIEEGPYTLLWVVLLLRLFSAIGIWSVKKTPKPREAAILSWDEIFSGIRFVWKTKIILGAISLDLFAVLLGGAVALLPVYANDILHVGSWGLGFLRASPSVGAALMALWISRKPNFGNAGKIMLAAVAVFGIATIAFGLSTNFYLSLAILFILGAADMISVVIRGVLVQTQTPPEMRGRVSAVNLIFIGASNELGEFESGVTARWFGTVPAVMIGGIGTLLIVGLWAKFFPTLRKYDRLHA